MNVARLSFAPCLLVSLAIACGGITPNSRRDPGSETKPDSGEDGDDLASACVDATITSADLACTTDDDCVFSATGKLCPDDCCAGGAVVNSAAAARIGGETNIFAAACRNAECGAPFGEPRCVHGSCAACETSSTVGTTCMATLPDGGTVTTKPDGGNTTAPTCPKSPPANNAPQCPAHFDTSNQGKPCPVAGLSCGYPGEGDFDANGCAGPGGISCQAPGQPGTPPDSGGPTWIITE